MRLRAIFFAAIVFAGAGAAAYKVAEVATARYEAATADQLNAALEAAGQRWVSVATDGLKVTLAGAAPDETSRFRALEIARQIVDAGRVEDTTTLADAAPLPPAPFALELLRNESDVSLIGLVPETGGRDVIQAALRAGGLAANVTDMLESASDPAPEGWQEALGYGLSVLSELPRAKISVAPRSVRVIAVADSEAAREKLEEGLQRAKPEGIALMLELSAPRAVIAPFVFDFSLADGVGRLDACSAESEEAAAALLAAAEAAGLAAGADCRVGLGAPAAGWGHGGRAGDRCAEGAGRRALHAAGHHGRADAAGGRVGRDAGRGGGAARHPPAGRHRAPHHRAGAGGGGGDAGAGAGVRRGADGGRRGAAVGFRHRRDVAGRDPELCRLALRARPGDRHHDDRGGAARRMAGAGAGRRRGAGGAERGQGGGDARDRRGRRAGGSTRTSGRRWRSCWRRRWAKRPSST